jgi:hypothetical protein
MNSKRGRPRKSGQDSGGEGRSYWLGEVFVDQGWDCGTDTGCKNNGGGEA